MRWSPKLSTRPPAKPPVPSTTMPSAVSDARPPMAFSPAQILCSRSLSFSRSRAAPRNTVRPVDAPAATASAGSRSGTSVISMLRDGAGAPISSNSAVTRRSPCADVSERPVTATSLPSARASSQNAPDDQSPSAASPAGAR